MSYDDFSRFYDLLTDNVEYEKRADYFCRLLSICGINEGILLDLGCGTGVISLLCAQRSRFAHVYCAELQKSFAE